MINNIYENNLKVFSSNDFISSNDVLLKPTTGILKSRKEAFVDFPFLYSSPMDTVTGIEFTSKLLQEGQSPVFCRFFNDEILHSALTNFYENQNFWFSVGASSEDYDALDLYFKDKEGTINVAVDVAHGDTIHMHKIYAKYNSAKWCNMLMSGTIATSKSAFNVVKYGCTHIRVGIGPGSACSTRIVTGCGVPNLSAIYDVWTSFQEYPSRIRPIIIADGGIKATGDIIKCLAAGADAVMIGNLFSQCIESAGWKTDLIKKILNTITLNKYFKNYLYKKYRGQASKDFQLQYKGVVSGMPEGVTGNIQHPTNTIVNFVSESKSAIASALSYLGLKDIRDLNPNNVQFIKITNASYQESKPHLLTKD